MSFKLFFLSTFKGLKNTAKVESQRDALWADFLEYEKLQGSDELKLYLELDQDVNSSSFKKESSTIKALKFAGSPEAKLQNKYSKLEKNSKLQDFYVTRSSADFQKYLELNESPLIQNFSALRDYVQSKKYNADKAAFKSQQKKGSTARFEDTDAFRRNEEYQALANSADVMFWMEYPKGKAYKNYLKMKDSPVLKRFEELRAETESAEFIDRKEFLMDMNRWEKTEAYLKEKTYQEMKNEVRFQIYEKYKKPDAFTFFLNNELLLEDNFEGGKLDKSKWKPISSLAENTLGKNFSKVGDLQAYTEGANILQSDSYLKLAVKKEKTDSLVWNFPIGFNPAGFDYSAGLLCSTESFRVDSGVLEAKIKFQPNKQLVDLFYLSDDKNSFRLSLLEAGTVCRFGLNADQKEQHKSLSSLAAGQFYIFRLEWEKGRISWKINGHEIYSVSHSLPAMPLWINMSSIVVEPPQELPHYFEIDWVRLYQKK